MPFSWICLHPPSIPLLGRLNRAVALFAVYVAPARHAQQDYAYAAVIGELQTLLADAQTDDADDAEPGVPVAA